MNKIITISREFGSGGRELGKRLADELNYAYYDKEIITAIAKETGMTEEYIEESEKRINPIISLDNNYYGLSTDDELFIKETELVKELAKKEIKNLDKLRATHYKYYTGQDWKDYSNYDICINSDAFGVEKSANMICEIVKTKLSQNENNKVTVK